MVQLLFLKYLPQYASQEKSFSDLSMSKYNLQRASFGYCHHNSSYIHFLIIESNIIFLVTLLEIFLINMIFSSGNSDC